MSGWKVFKHSFGLVVRNFWKAVQIFAVPWLLALVAGGLTIFVLGLPADFYALESGYGDFPIGKTILGGLIGIAVLVFTSIWVAIAWHRFILLEEHPTGFIPPLKKDRMIGYFVRGLLLTLIFLIPSLLVGIIVGFVAALQSPGPIIVVGAISVVVFFALIIVSYRLSIVLPAEAIGNRLSFSQAFNATHGATKGLIVILLCFVGLSVAIETVGLMFTFFPLLDLVYVVATTAFTSMLNISILTTLYGIYIENREIN